MSLNCKRTYLKSQSLAARFMLLVAISTSLVAYAAGNGSLCREGEHQYFSCTLKSKKTAAVCGGGTGDTSYMQYRFGKPGKVELEFPTSRTDSVSQFRISRYFRAAQDGNDSLTTQDLMFTNNETTYDLSATEEGRHNGVGIIVTGKDGKSVTLNCVAGGMNIPLELEAKIPCDPDASVNTASCDDAN
jgi:hypothetical protein